MLINNTTADNKSMTLNKSPVNMKSPLTKRVAPKKRITWIGKPIEKIIDKKARDANKSISPNILTNTIKKNYNGSLKTLTKFL